MPRLRSRVRVASKHSHSGIVRSTAPGADPAAEWSDGNAMRAREHRDDELVVATLSGDLFVLNAATMAELWRTHVPGAIGLYSSMLAEDLDGLNGKELYVAGSWGLWRFTLVQP